MTSRRYLLVFVSCLALASLTGCARGNLAERLKIHSLVTEPADYQEINADNPGQKVKPSQYVVRGKYTIIDFYSPYCGPCMAIRPRLQELAKARRDIAIRSININRPGVEGIDWRSPALDGNVAYQSIPYFKIYGPHGQLIADGRDASNQVHECIHAEFD